MSEIAPVVAIVSLLGLILTFSTSIVMIAFKVGGMSAKIEELQRWRADIRADLHEVSDQLDAVRKELHGLGVLIVERTERRTSTRIPIDEK